MRSKLQTPMLFPSIKKRLIFFALFFHMPAHVGCIEVPSTQLMAIFLADDEIANEITDVELKVYGSSEGTPPEHVATVHFTHEDFPASVALVPADPDDESREFGLQATASDEDARPRAIVRARGRYVPDEARTAYLRFDNDCLDILHCSPDETCSLGRCVNAELTEADYGELGDGETIGLPPIARPDRALVHVGESVLIHPLENDRDPEESDLRLERVEVWDAPSSELALKSVEIVDGASLRVSFDEYPGETVRYVYTVQNERGLKARALIRLDVVDRDSDGDGIPDNIERASGCLDPFNPDTDGDGIPDGVEDANRNGRVDGDETDPCRISTDDTGVCDGAWRTPIPDGCEDFAVRFIDPSRPTGGTVDGLSWETAFFSLEQALQAESSGTMPVSRHYWIREGTLDSFTPIYLVQGHFQRIYGGFRGEEPSAAHRSAHHWTEIDPAWIEPGSPFIAVSHSQSLIFDGFAFRGIRREHEDDALPPPLVRVYESQSVRLSRLLFSEVESEAAIEAQGVTDLVLDELIVFRSAGRNEESAGLIHLNDVQGRLSGSLFVNNPGEERQILATPSGKPSVQPLIRLSAQSDDTVNDFEIVRSGFYANKAERWAASIFEATFPISAPSPKIRMADIKMLLPAYAALPSSALNVRGADVFELLNVEIYDRSARIDIPDAYVGATDQTIRVFDANRVSIRHLTNDTRYISPWNRLLFVNANESGRATQIRIEDSVSTQANPIYDQNDILAQLTVEVRRYCATERFELSPENAPTPKGCPPDAAANGDSLVQGLGIELEELSATPGGLPVKPPLRPGYHSRRAGPYLERITRGATNGTECAPSLAWSATASDCLLLRSGAMPLKLETEGNLGSSAFLDVLACFGEGPPIVSLPPVVHDCHPDR